MPKQLIREGRLYHLIPLENSNDLRTPKEINENAASTGDYTQFAYISGIRAVKNSEDGVIDSQEPVIWLHWSKEPSYSESTPNDQGYVHLEFEIDQSAFDRLVAQRKNELNSVEGAPKKVSIISDQLSWRDLNILVKAAKQARDGAFGKPE